MNNTPDAPELPYNALTLVYRVLRELDKSLIIASTSSLV